MALRHWMQQRKVKRARNWSVIRLECWPDSSFFPSSPFFCVRDPPSEAENPITSAAEGEFHFLWLPRLYSVCISVNRAGRSRIFSRMNVFRSESFVGWNSEEKKFRSKFHLSWHRFAIVIRLLDAFTDSTSEDVKIQNRNASLDRCHPFCESDFI